MRFAAICISIAIITFLFGIWVGRTTQENRIRQLETIQSEFADFGRQELQGFTGSTEMHQRLEQFVKEVDAQRIPSN
jgi:hypothetical protein